MGERHLEQVERDKQVDDYMTDGYKGIEQSAVEADVMSTQYRCGMVEDSKYSACGTARQSRPRSRCRHRHSHSRSDSRSSSSRHKRSKWAITKCVMGRKSVRRLNASELIGHQFVGVCQ